MTQPPDRLRLDKWLWHARFFKSRTLAAAAIGLRKVRVDGVPVSKSSTHLRPGAVLTFAQGDRVRVVRVLALGTRRGPAPEAQTLYEDLSPPAPLRDLSQPMPEKGGRPTKRDRRRMERPLE